MLLSFIPILSKIKRKMITTKIRNQNILKEMKVLLTKLFKKIIQLLKKKYL
jgi:hypothetical protein